MKKILIFSLAYYPNTVSGAEAAIKEITDRLSPDDFEFHLITCRYNSSLPKQEKIGNVFIYRIGLTKKNPRFEDLSKLPLDLNKPLYQFLAAGKACRLHKKYKYDAVWAIMAHSAGVPAVLFKIFHPKIKYILTLQEGDPIKQIEKTMKPVWPLFKRAFTKAEQVQVISQYLADWAQHRGVPKNKIELIHNGANPRDIKAEFDKKELDKLKETLGKKADEVWLINTARLVHQKANDDIIRALAHLPENIKLLLVGDGPDEQMLKDLAKELKLADRVIFAGRVDRSEVSNYRKISDIFVGPSRSEGLGNAFLSAMASKLPVVATKEGGLAEFISNETAWVVKKDTPDQIAQAIKNILANPNKVKKVTAQARNMVVDKYNWDMVAKEMKEKIFSII